MPTLLEQRVEALRRAHRLAEVVAGYGVELKPAGRALVGPCPLHTDGSHPNLHVYPDATHVRDSWYCYRCHEGGDVIDFVMHRESLDFAAACARLESSPIRPSRPVRAPPPVPEPLVRSWERLSLDEQVVMDTAAGIYQRRLWEEPRALGYVRRRGIPDEVIRAAGIGFADGRELEAHLRRRWGLAVALDLGLLRRREGGDASRGLRELFAGRVVVPEVRGGHCVWFIGRRLDDRPDRRTYLTLAGERPVLGRELAIGQSAVVLCEGVFDYLTARAWGLPACSPCGTHLPADRLAFLTSAETVYGVLDGDDAGREAADRFGGLLGARWRPLRLPAGRDLNDLGRDPGGRDEFDRLLTAARQSVLMEEHDDA